jgi:hypothetical protein
VVNAHYKGAENSRTHGRAATEIYEQLFTIKNGGLSVSEAEQLLEEAMESAKRLAVHAWTQARQHDEDAKTYATKALRLPSTLKHLETKESSSKREAFNNDFIEMYNEANYQQRVLRAATTNSNNSSYGRGRGGYSASNWNSNRGGRGFFSNGRGKNFYGGRGRGAPTFNNNNNIPYNNTNSSHNSTTQYPQQGNSNHQ